MHVTKRDVKVATAEKQLSNLSVPQICENYGPNLDTCPEGTVLGLLVDANSCLHLYVNGMDQGVAAQDIPSPCYPVIDLYGQCEQVGVFLKNQNKQKWMKPSPRQK